MNPWNLAQKICNGVENGGMSGTDLFKCFNTLNTSNIIKLPYEEVLTKYENYQKTKELESFISFCKTELSKMENAGLAMDGNTNYLYSPKELKELFDTLYKKYLMESK